jgi:hypothetical protein
MYLSPAPTKYVPTDAEVKPARAMGLQHCNSDNWKYLVVRNVLQQELISQDCGTDETSLSQAFETAGS